MMTFSDIQKTRYDNSNKRPTSRVMLLIILTLIAGGFALGIFFVTRDWYRYNVISLSYADNTFSIDSKGLYIHTFLYINTTDSYDTAANWYEQRGWGCDGNCEHFKKVEFSVFTLTVWKNFSTNTNPKAPPGFLLLEEYVLKW